jgi:hypothetical protein
VMGGPFPLCTHVTRAHTAHSAPIKCHRSHLHDAPACRDGLVELLLFKTQQKTLVVLRPAQQQTSSVHTNPLFSPRLN